MKKILFAIGYFALLLLCAVLIFKYSYNAFLIYNYNNQNYNISTTPLGIFNFAQSYIVHYNQGNIHYQKGEYEDAIRAYNETLALNLPKGKECSVRINLALAMLGTIKEQYDDPAFREDTIQVLLKAREVLLVDGCATVEGDGHSREAEKLKEEIEAMLEEQQQKQQQEQQDSQGSPDTQQEENSSDTPQDQEAEEEQAASQAQKQKEQMIKNELKEKQEQANREREDDMAFIRGMEEGYNFLVTDEIW